MSRGGERRRAALLRALWNRTRPIATWPLPEPGGPPQRPRFDDDEIRLPHGAAPVRAADDRLAEASLAHIGAHLAFGSGRFAAGSLRPVQVALVSLIEDARVEALALRERPGLRRLWLPFHAAEPGARTAPDLMARLSRALLDPGSDDPDAFVAKGRALFFADPSAWTDPGFSRRLGDRLGNDLGQMRVPFSPRSYIVEPAYRDDHAGLWEQPEPEAASGPERLPGDAAARAAGVDPPPGPAASLRRYPEWDHRIRCARPDWASVREEEPATGPTRSVAPDPRLDRTLSLLRLSRMTRRRRQLDGDELDLAAAVDAVGLIRSGRQPEPRLYARIQRRPAPVPVLLLIDVSLSTADPAPGGGRLIDAALDVAYTVIGALPRLQVPLAVMAFRSAGRHDVRATWIKRWSDAPGIAAGRLAALAPGGSTRLGAALRHAGGMLPPGPGLILVLTDGEPSDIDIHDPAYLVADAREACRRLAGDGVTVLGLALAHAQIEALARICTARRCVSIHTLSRLRALIGTIGRGAWS
ncbi:nitric oxide reductase activation protein NorD [Methylobacterium nonmethylotrophicum]|uniref:VWFA domain-containing protein n=1 Tax=Methylobacterium nonmethylotrophicum TaxID=1141884 RepID=A0A4Z0NSF3_9HYPH|nr:hypothetical protein [Methylobacterium nonmethylotrophicum]TGD99448.1 hypothetical protein EU555_13170 [Methylobacterium nonmethylotrophicum]